MNENDAKSCPNVQVFLLGLSKESASHQSQAGSTVDKRSPQSHLCDPGSIPVLAFSCGLSLLLVLSLLRGFFSGFSGFPTSTKTNTSRPPVCQCPHCWALPSINKVYYYYYYYFYFFFIILFLVAKREWHGCIGAFSL